MCDLSYKFIYTNNNVYSLQKQKQKTNQFSTNYENNRKQLRKFTKKSLVLNK